MGLTFLYLGIDNYFQRQFYTEVQMPIYSYYLNCAPFVVFSLLCFLGVTWNRLTVGASCGPLYWGLWICLVSSMLLGLSMRVFPDSVLNIIGIGRGCTDCLKEDGSPVTIQGRFNDDNFKAHRYNVQDHTTWHTRHYNVVQRFAIWTGENLICQAILCLAAILSEDRLLAYQITSLSACFCALVILLCSYMRTLLRSVDQDFRTVKMTKAGDNQAGYRNDIALDAFACYIFVTMICFAFSFLPEALMYDEFDLIVNNFVRNREQKQYHPPGYRNSLTMRSGMLRSGLTMRSSMDLRSSNSMTNSVVPSALVPEDSDSEE